ncbi:hypothetical protein BD289DRAFT_105629 [Coniella lustricola]|uniref:Ankyrin repeat protein n=1 Tax=Coniella lustricola TaxID=2025994 RepID=A0A2T2ZXN9_9PEZI|nr:hypothetical protein BD289DRAFT_105629 [Coniella lustricola]
MDNVGFRAPSAALQIRNLSSMAIASTASTPGLTSTSSDNDTEVDRLWKEIRNTNNRQVSCLCILPHDLEDMRDLRCHFFGCLQFKQRIEVFDNSEDKLWKQAERLEREHARATLGQAAEIPSMGQMEPRTAIMYTTALSLQAELKRIAVLRNTPALKDDVRAVSESLNAWRIENKEAIEIVKSARTSSRTWHKDMPSGRLKRHATVPLSNGHAPSEPNASPTPTAPVSSDSVEFADKLKEVIERICRDNSFNSCFHNDEDPRLATYDLKRDVKARVIKLERPHNPQSAPCATLDDKMKPMEESMDDRISKGRFPDQALSMSNLMDENFKQHERHKKDNLMEKTCPSNLRYYHIPVNNMSWVEEAISNYFSESNTPAVHNGHKRAQLGPQTSRVLQDSCWKGQEHRGGPGSVVHTRNLRPLCEKISTDIEDLSSSDESHPTGLVLFMPYLHWETDRRRHQAASLTEQLADQHDLDERETRQAWKSKRKEDRQDLTRFESVKFASPSSAYQEPDYYSSRGKDRKAILDSLAEILWRKFSSQETSPPPRLPTVIWQKIRDDEKGGWILNKLKIAIKECASSQKIPDSLKQVVFEPQSVEIADRTEMRDWDHILWHIKEAVRGPPTPHSLVDVFWEEIKRARKRADEEKEAAQFNNAQDADAQQASGAWRRRLNRLFTASGIKHEKQTAPMKSRKIFQKPTHLVQGVDVDEYGHLQPTKLLARVLIQAARLYERIITFQDRAILEKYLYYDPPLHPRRTLDQAYFWRLRDTRLRDRDQVVYRYTNADFTHKYRPQPPSDPRNDRSSVQETSNSTFRRLAKQCKHDPKSQEWLWTRHGAYEKEYGCDQCNEDIREVSRVIMVDQLWLWCLDKDTILTCFPQRYGVEHKDVSGVHQTIRSRVKDRSKPDNQVRSIFDLALIILEECFGTFFNRMRAADRRPQMIDVFAESIGRVTNKQAIAFQHLWTLSQRLTDIYQSGLQDKVDPHLMLSLLNVTPEAELQREIGDIIDELDIMLHVTKQQQEMVNRFVKFALEIMSADIQKVEQKLSEKHHITTPKTETEPGLTLLIKTVRAKDQDDANVLNSLSQQLKTFKIRSDDVVAKIQNGMAELAGLRASAISTQENVNALLSLKQQQASVVQAYEAMKQGEETVRQGKAIVVFTVMTIVFLPMSFMSSLFGMNAVELTGSGGDGSPSASTSGPLGDIDAFWPVTFKRQILVMFAISFGAVQLVIIPVFSPFIRAVYSAVFHQVAVKFITATGLYRLWLQSGLRSSTVRNESKEKAHKMRKRVREDLNRNRLLQSEILDGKRELAVKVGFFRRRFWGKGNGHVVGDENA